MKNLTRYTFISTSLVAIFTTIFRKYLPSDIFLNHSLESIIYSSKDLIKNYTNYVLTTVIVSQERNRLYIEYYDDNHNALQLYVTHSQSIEEKPYIKGERYSLSHSKYTPLDDESKRQVIHLLSFILENTKTSYKI